MEGRGQGSIEYLLIIGAAIVIAVIVIAVVVSIGGGNKESTNQTTLEAQDMKECLIDCCYKTQSIKYNLDKNVSLPDCNSIPNVCQGLDMNQAACLKCNKVKC
ncbi:MAG: class III signal peptide-containing protein [Candidatus Diapherotrites archaeon]|nr:class III signal peptide-containing protein [Candidatus Diapherotrites archaeon]